MLQKNPWDFGLETSPKISQKVTKNFQGDSPRLLWPGHPVEGSKIHQDSPMRSGPYFPRAPIPTETEGPELEEEPPVTPF